MFIEIHMIQNFAPSNLNRDDTNNPKDCEFGGVRRARISSQCIKRAIRMEPIFQKTTGIPNSQRTRLIKGELERLLSADSIQEEAEHKADVFAKFYSSKKGNMDDDRTTVLLFMSQQEMKEIAQEIKDMQDEEQIKKYAEEFAKKNPERPSAPDIALFGRMLADRPETNLDAACQVAHAISTHRVNMDIDFFTAVDDLQHSDESGSAMMGVTGFNSACFYRYMRLDWGQLLKNLGEDAGLALKTVEGFLRAALSAVPTGKQNSFAAQNPPDFLLAVTRSDGACWSLANAFEKPASADYEHSLLENSILKADAYWGRLLKFYGGEVQPTAALLIDGLELPNLQSVLAENADAWVKAVLAQLPVQ